MPTYDYRCTGCGDFDALRRISARDEPCPCPDCGQAATRVLGTAPQLACMAGETRQAHETNERARHVPRSSRDAAAGAYGRLRHPSGCGCCSSTPRRGGTVTAADGAKSFPAKRPWMISH
ncbi:MAG: zinc ribbon domain-containing protein [Pseudomonadota bacterium]